MSMEDRLVDIEIKLTRHDDTIDSLNGVIYRQQQKIDDLEKMCLELARRLRELTASTGAGMPANEKPPHY